MTPEKLQLPSMKGECFPNHHFSRGELLNFRGCTFIKKSPRLFFQQKMEVWKMIFLFKWAIVRFHVDFLGCKLFQWEISDIDRCFGFVLRHCRRWQWHHPRRQLWRENFVKNDGLPTWKKGTKTDEDGIETIPKRAKLNLKRLKEMKVSLSILGWLV